ncbi:MAG TPA: hypothetical protein VK554_10215 [Bradyrhizobium sp.]|nr:hypothetical protein [Bradyrhizobium sp.]
MILTGAADGRVSPKAAVGRKEGWRAGGRKEWEQFSRLNEGFDLSSMSEDATHRTSPTATKSARMIRSGHFVLNKPGVSSSASHPTKAQWCR